MIFKQLGPSTILVTPFTVYKNHSLVSNDTSSISYYTGQFYNGVFGQAQLQNFKKTNGNFYEFIIHQSINSLYDNLYLAGQEKVLYETVQVISIPQNKFGEALKKNSISMSIDLPDKNYQMIWNNKFEILSQPTFSLSNIPSNANTWYYMGNNNTNVNATISNNILYLSSSYSATDTAYIIQKINSNTLPQSGNYLLRFNINDFSGSNTITNIDAAIYQPSASILITQSFDITTLNNPYEYEFTGLDSTVDAWIWLYLNYDSPISISLSDISLYKEITHNLRDDGKGNIYDVSYSQSSAILKSELDQNKIAEWNFRNGYQKKDQNVNYIYTRDDSKYLNHALCNNITFVDGLYSTKASFQTNNYKTEDIVTI